jgi:hypothetical protein
MDFFRLYVTDMESDMHTRDARRGRLLTRPNAAAETSGRTCSREQITQARATTIHVDDFRLHHGADLEVGATEEVTVVQETTPSCRV